MIIEEAARFGLSQLHQLRGRIGRGPEKSWCILLHDGAIGSGLEKLEVLEKTSDGFEIAEADLLLRGPGDIIGTAQTGLPSLGLGDLIRDSDIMTDARKVALDILEEDPELRNSSHVSMRNYVLKNAIQQELSAG
jgi:ATP-dependent DNA helicase RecG